MGEILFLTTTVLIIYSLHLSYLIRNKISKGVPVDMIDKFFVMAFCVFVFSFSLSLLGSEGTAIYWGDTPKPFLNSFIWFHLLVFIYQFRMIWHSKPKS